MIKEIDDYGKIVHLWQEAFGDTVQDILFFTSNCTNKKCIVYLCDDKVASMLFLVDCECENIAAHYVYAACTLKSMQGKGYMTQILKYCFENYKNICLIPASDSLVKYYNDRGLLFEHSIDDLSFNETNEIKEYLLEGYELTNPSVLADFS